MIAVKNNDTTLDQLARMMAEGFDRMENRFDAIDLRFAAVDERFEAIDKRFERIDRRFELIDGRFDSLEKRFDILARESMRLDDDIHDVKNNLSSLTGMYVEQETAIESLDERVSLLETKAR